MRAPSSRRRKAGGSTSDESARLPSPARRPERAPIDFDVLEGHLGYFLRRLQVAVFKDFIATLAARDVRPAQYSVLVLIGANPGRSQADIGEALDIERARLARLLHDLEARNWIRRLAATRDRRSHSLYLTSEGRRSLDGIKDLAARHERQMAKLVGGERRLLLLKLLKDFG
jgi:DNA-binding MarR family transcriptional regulator